MNNIERKLLEELTDLHSIPQGAYNLRKNGAPVARVSSEEIEIVPKKDKSGIDIYVKKGTKNKSVHIPVIITEGGIDDVVYNDFYIGDDSDVLIVAGCGIHNPSKLTSVHNGIHTFHVGKNSKVKYVERHLGVGNGSGDKILNPVTKVYLKENSFLEMETVQLKGVSSAIRKTSGILYDNANLIVNEKILTTANQTAKTQFNVVLKGKGAGLDIISRSVAKNSSKQEFYSSVKGENECFAHVECDGILVDNAVITSTPKIIASNVNATLVHEAAIGKIAGDQVIKLQTLGLTEKEAEDLIIKGFLS